MAKFGNEMSKTSIFHRRKISRSKSSGTVPSFLKKVGGKLPLSLHSSGTESKSSSSTYVSWWMPLPPLTPATPHQTSSIGLDKKNELVFQFPSKGPSSYDGHEEYSKTMPDGKSSLPLIRCETDQEKNKHHRVVRSKSSPVAATWLPPIPKGPVCLVGKQELAEDHAIKKICDSPSPRSRRENELLEEFSCSLGEQSEEENDYELTLSPTVAEINFFLVKLASGSSRKNENKPVLCEEHENESSDNALKSIGVSKSNLTVTLPKVQRGLHQK